MQTTLSQISGEELLLMRIFGDGAAAEAVERELDRRAIEGPPAGQTRRDFAPARSHGGRRTAA